MIVRNVCPVGLLCVALSCPVLASADDFASDATVDAIQAFFRDHLGVENQKAAIVVGIVDEHGHRITSHGELDTATDEPLNGDSLFFIGSVTKTFTALLLMDMVERGEMRLDDPVAKYLPDAVRLPTHAGKEITLLHLATHTAGLPPNPDNMVGADVKEQYESYTVERMYDFLSDHALTDEPGTRFAYSNVGMALLGHAMALRAGQTFESLVVERICRRLGMDSTRITLSAEQRARLAIGRDKAGKPAAPWKFKAYSPAGDLHSSANDLLKYISAQVGLLSSPLTPLMEKTHVFRHRDTQGLPGQNAYELMGRTAMPWFDRDANQPPGMELLGHAGGAGSYHAWVGFDKKQRRGVVVLSTANELSVEAIGWTILQRVPLTAGSKDVFTRELVGIGATIEMDDATRMLRITRVFENSPAATAGLSAGDVIQRIDDVPTAGKSLNECLDLIRGPIGSMVRFELNEPQHGKMGIVEVIRDRYILSS